MGLPDARAIAAAEILSKLSAQLVDPIFMYRKGGRSSGGGSVGQKPVSPPPAQVKTVQPQKTPPPVAQGAPQPTSKGVTFQMPTRPPKGK